MGDTTSIPCFNSETSRISFEFATNDTLHKTVSVGMLNDDVLLVIFHFCRLTDEEKNGFDDSSCRFGVESAFNDQWNLENLEGNWDRQRWWHKCWWHQLTQVCQRWRSLILASPSRLNLYLVCTKDTPVAEMLAHFLHLPLVVVYKFEEGESPRHERNILLSLQHRHRVRSIRLSGPTSALQKMTITLDEEFPSLVSLAIIPVGPVSVIPPKLLRLAAPNLRHLLFKYVVIQTGTPTLITSIHLTTLVLERILASTHITPEYLVDLLELMPQLLILSVSFCLPISGLVVATHPLAPEAQNRFITLRRLERLRFLGASSYLEVLLARINAPVLEQLYIYLFLQHSFGTLPNISRFLDTTGEFRSRIALVNFHRFSVTIEIGDKGRNKGNRFPLRICVKGNFWERVIGWQIASASQICSAIAPVFSVTEELILGDHIHGTPSNDNRLNWQNIFRQFGSIKTLMVSDGLVEELSLHLQPDGADEALLGLLPRLERIVVPRDVGDAFTAIIDSRRFAGHHVHLFHDYVPMREWRDLCWRV